VTKRMWLWASGGLYVVVSGIGAAPLGSFCDLPRLPPSAARQDRGTSQRASTAIPCAHAWRRCLGSRKRLVIVLATAVWVRALLALAICSRPATAGGDGDGGGDGKMADGGGDGIANDGWCGARCV